MSPTKPGAPPRLKTHIAGESLLNDGAAIVFFSIFSQKFLSELDIAGLGKDVGGAEGVKVRHEMRGHTIEVFVRIRRTDSIHFVS